MLHHVAEEMKLETLGCVVRRAMTGVRKAYGRKYPQRGSGEMALGGSRRKAQPTGAGGAGISEVDEGFPRQARSVLSLSLSLPLRAPIAVRHEPPDDGRG